MNRELFTETRKMSPKEIYEKKVNEKLGWKIIAEMAGVSETHAIRLAKGHAEENDLEWPLVLTGDAKTAFVLRKNTHMKWSAIAERTGFRTIEAAIIAVKRYCEVNRFSYP